MINLLSKKKLKFDKQAQLALRVRVWSGMVLAGYVAVMVISLLVNQIYVFRINSAKKALDEAKFQLTSKVALVSQYESVVKRAAVIKSLLVKRRESVGLWETTRAMLPQGVELTQFGLTGDDLGLGFKAPTVILANQMLDVIETQFNQIDAATTKVDINRSDDASYNISADVVLASKKDQDE
jgi:Tfp pilus assembly protein PilN